MKKVFAEVGFGNGTFFSTEFEEGDSEYRIAQFIKPSQIDDHYFRLWIFKKVLVLSTKDGIKVMSKSRNSFKILFGLGGIIK
jgi:hypothetical protein